jgi:hypothetical protein
LNVVENPAGYPVPGIRPAPDIFGCLDFILAVFLIRIHMDPHSIGRLDPDPAA